jgi:hypothetical protein
MTEFLTNMPTDTKIFITMAVLAFGGNADSAETADLRSCTSPTSRSQQGLRAYAAVTSPLVLRN